MSEPRRPLFGFLWPKPDPHAPVDAEYRQVRPTRISPRGPIRLGGLIVGTLVTAMTAGAIIMGGVIGGQVLPAVLAGALTATAIVLILRGWIVGTFVSDESVRIETTWRRRDVPWSDITAVSVDRSSCPFLGAPLRMTATRAFLVTASGERVPTHVYALSPDYLLRPEAFDMALMRLERWLPTR
jgi:hypothetical protein